MQPTLKQLAYRYLREKLENGDLAPGARLSDLALSREIGISRTPVREAVNQLAAEGLAMIIPHAGAFVRQADPSEIEELYEVRVVLEGLAAKKAAASMSQSQITELGNQIAVLERLLADAEAAGEAELEQEATRVQQATDRAFHEAIIEASGNQKLMEMFKEFHILSSPFAVMRLTIAVGVLRKAILWHQRIYQAIQNRSSTAARRAMEKHIEEGLKSFRKENRKRTAPVSAKIPKALRPFV